MKKIVLLTLLSVTLLSSCRERAHKPPTLEAVRSAERARTGWAKISSENHLVQETSKTDTVKTKDRIEISTLTETKTTKKDSIIYQEQN